SVANYDELVLIKREYKIMNLTENRDTVTREMKLLAALSPREKQFHFYSDNNFRVYSMFNPLEVEMFILPLNSALAQNFLNNPEETKIISIKDFEIVQANFDGIAQ